MSNVKVKFTLHTHYKNFGLSQESLQLKILSLLKDIGSLIRLFTKLLVLGCILLVINIWVVNSVIQDQLFLHHGLDTAVKISNCTKWYGSKGGRTASTLDYVYNINEQVYSGSIYLTNPWAWACEDYPIGTYLRAVYLDSNPSTLRIKEFSASPLGEVVKYLCVIVISLAAIPFMRRSASKHLKLYLQKRQKKLLFKHGLLLEGEIVSIQGSRQGSDFMVVVNYQFVSPTQNTVGGYASAHRRDLNSTNLPPIGTPIAILYMDDKTYMML
jgi:hypothetical protein